MTVPSNVDPLDLIQALIDAKEHFHVVVDGEHIVFTWNIPGPYPGWWSVKHYHGWSTGQELVLHRPKRPGDRLDAPYIVLDGNQHFNLRDMSRIFRHEHREDVIVWTATCQWREMANTLFHARNVTWGALDFIEKDVSHSDLYYRIRKTFYDLDDLKCEVEREEKKMEEWV